LRSPAAAFRRVANEPDVPIRAICRLISSNTDFTYTILHRSCAAMFSEPACHPDAMRLHFAAKRRGIRAPRLSPAAVGLCYYRHFPNQIALADLDDREYQWPPKRGMIAYELLETGTLVSFRIVEEEVLSAPDEAEFGLRLQLKFVPDDEDEEQDEDNAAEDTTEWGAFGFMFVVGVLSFANGGFPPIYGLTCAFNKSASICATFMTDGRAFQRSM
jgi:hypothetical protein